ncbi:response regulator [Magnetovibrio sp.]|uniref:response regulator n=1 Tax=Magnetovibrio sp. TaxID=2024836 RepID=UPI002F93038D
MARILVIDDDPDIRGLLTTYFQGIGHQVFVAEDGAHGIGVAAQRRPDVVILDVDMPVLNGHSTLHVMKNDPKMSAIPVVVLTSRDDELTRERLHRAGCADFLGKPFELNALDLAVANSLKTSRG